MRAGFITERLDKLAAAGPRLELIKRTNADPRTLGNLFHAVCDDAKVELYT